MFKSIRPTPTARKGEAVLDTSGLPERGGGAFVKCKYCGFYCKTNRDVKCPLCDSDNYV